MACAGRSSWKPMARGCSEALLWLPSAMLTCRFCNLFLFLLLPVPVALGSLGCGAADALCYGDGAVHLLAALQHCLLSFHGCHSGVWRLGSCWPRKWQRRA